MKKAESDGVLRSLSQSSKLDEDTNHSKSFHIQELHLAAHTELIFHHFHNFHSRAKKDGDESHSILCLVISLLPLLFGSKKLRDKCVEP